jgi:elongation factor Ts
VVEIPATQVKELRDRTGAGMMDAKRALQAAEGDFDAAVRALRERGLAKAQQRGDRATSEGKINYQLADDHSWGAMVAVGCETEPVSNNDEFLAYAEKVLRAVQEQGEDAVAALEAERVELAAKLGENIQVVGAKRMEAADGATLSSYVHGPANRVGALVLAKGDPDAARSLALHLTFARPTYATRDEVPTELVDAEREILRNSDEVQSKPEAVRDKIVEGMLNKRFYGESVLTEQQWYRPDEATTTVAKVLADRGVELIDYAWFSVA